ncbi:hypothetical protein FOTG_04956 [Fusarium oxysporum f. sp. vasinfectum 25433]|uniref:Uncharacterized protein n=1 Tax=Fusarium oxysporum f. sp. vasinfectum 25433 TaxID=1089449 RepID=X0NB89_FUSOX|nr:hypothetical protein FOTG_04956 [Fusarium oxysporum f. sp. vasinfectum 25433]
MARLGYTNREQTQHDEHVSSQKAVREVMASPQARVCLSDANGGVETLNHFLSARALSRTVPEGKVIWLFLLYKRSLYSVSAYTGETLRRWFSNTHVKTPSLRTRCVINRCLSIGTLQMN